MRLITVASALIATALIAAPMTALAAGSDEPAPAPKPAPKPKPKPEPEPKDPGKEAPKAAPEALEDADYSAGKAAVEARQWKDAIALLARAAARDPGNANIQNYLGFAHRNDGDWERAIAYYRAALALDPQHRGANEYLGHAYLLRGNLRLAQGQLERLERICGRGCEQYASLSAAITEHRRNPR